MRREIVSAAVRRHGRHGRPLSLFEIALQGNDTPRAIQPNLEYFSPNFAPACRRHALAGKKNASTPGVSSLALELLAICAGLIGRVRGIQGSVNFGRIIDERQCHRLRILGIQRRKIRSRCRRCGIADQPECRNNGTRHEPVLDDRSTCDFALHCDAPIIGKLQHIGTLRRIFPRFDVHL